MVDSLHWEQEHNFNGPMVVPAEFARQLERELAEARLGEALHKNAAGQLAQMAVDSLPSSIAPLPADIERRMVEMIRYIGVKAGVAETTYGAMCHEARCILRNVHLDYDALSAVSHGPATAPEHVCGLTGYNPMIDPPCPGCVASGRISSARGASGR